MSARKQTISNTRESNYEVLGGECERPIKAWIKGVPMEAEAQKQLENVANLPFVHKWLAVMPDVHVGKGATIGSVIPTIKTIIPAAVGVDIGCGMMAVQTTMSASDLPDGLAPLRHAIEAAVPHGRTNRGGSRDQGAWGTIPKAQEQAWKGLSGVFKEVTDKHPKIAKSNNINHLGTLGTGNHFIEVCLDESDKVWVMLHSGSRGVGNRIGSYFIEKAKEEMRRFHINLPDMNLAYLPQGSTYFADYVQAVSWAQEFAMTNRKLMMAAVLEALRGLACLPGFDADLMAVNCHHNYVSLEHHYGKDVFVTRKGAVRARLGDMGIIPGSMGTRSYIVRGKGNDESFHSCSHGAGRVMSRTAAKKRYTVEDHERATEGVECRKDAEVVDETPMAYKDIDKVMEAQKDLVDIVHTIKQVVCVKG